MALRTQAARWFEVLVPRTSLARGAEALGATGLVQFDPDGPDGEPLDLSGLRERLQDYDALASRYRPLWPEPRLRRPRRDVLLEVTLDRALGRLQAWAEAAAPRARRLERLQGLAHDLSLLREFLAALGPAPQLHLEAVATPGERLASALLILPPDSEPPAATERLVYRQVATPERLYLLLLGEPQAVAAAVSQWTARKGRSLALPPWLAGPPGAALEQVDARLTTLEERIQAVRRQLSSLNRRHRLAAALGDIQRLEWLVDHLAGLPVTRDLAWITGWSAERGGGERLAGALEEAGIPAVMRFPPPPRGKWPPTLLHNPRWARPFELFVRLLGTPGQGDSDPSGLLAVIAPLLFGYMFGDVGQGAVLMAAGVALRRRLPVADLLIWGGAAAIVFGLAFGSVFAREDLIPALWIHPIDHPLQVLAPPLVLGAVLIALGQGVHGLGAWWSGSLGHWLRRDLGLLVMYTGALLGLLVEEAFLLAGAGAAWFVLGPLLTGGGHRLRTLAAGVGELAEETLRLLVNTLSFVRVGAFALAHAGLSLAVVSLADAAGPVGGLVVLVLGNVGIIALEGLVVSVQTTRLILFEFFIRFLQGEGRPFEPSRPPAGSAPA